MGVHYRADKMLFGIFNYQNMPSILSEQIEEKSAVQR
jgi:hypothetical protein